MNGRAEARHAGPGSLAGERDAWIVLASATGVGPETVAALLARFGGARAVLDAATSGALRRWNAQRPLGGDMRWHRLPGAVLADLEAWPSAGVDRLHRLAELGLWAVTPLDADYPVGLRDLDPLPPLLIGCGERRNLLAPRPVALVGTRRPTANGRWLAGRAAARLVEAGAMVISGLALGIDGVAHAAALERGGRTLGVIGGGHLHPGPRAHESLRRRIAEAGGTIISEYAPDVQPTKGTYPRRNRIIAALAQAVLVIEAPARSGALITARDALELGRPVLVAPGRIGDWSVAGSLGLLRGTPARILAGLDEMLEDLGLLAAAEAPVDVAAAPAPAPDQRRVDALGMLDGAQRAVAERVCRSPADLDTLVDDTGLAPAVVSSAVTLLLMRGWIQPVGPAYLPAGALLS